MADTETHEQPYVLRVERVQESIRALLARDTHQHFIGYLHVRRRAGTEGTNEGLAPQWSELAERLRIDGGPPDRPNFRPFWTGQRKNFQEWMNPNLAGSFSPASQRSVLGRVLKTDARTQFSLREHHWEAAREHLLLGVPMPVLPLAGFLFRDYGLVASTAPDAEALIALFRREYGYGPDDDEEYRRLYDESWRGSDGPWSEPYTGEEQDVSLPLFDGPELHLTSKPIRHLTALDLNLEVPRQEPPSSVGAASAVTDEGTVEPPLPASDDVLARVEALLNEYGGVIFSGPPGTSKSWYARRIGISLVDGDMSRLRFLQFHPSYQYEDFVEGYVPKPHGGFERKPKHFLEMCDLARARPDARHVLVIDELSRGDPGRIFGEVLTYIERTKRDYKFNLASGEPCIVPRNLVILATMNPLDRGVDEVDAAFGRRFARIRMDPNEELLSFQLIANGMADGLRERVLTFFRSINRYGRTNPHATIGHTYFYECTDESDLERVWDHQLQFIFEKAYELDADGLEAVRQQYDRMIEVSTPRQESRQ